MHLSSTFCKTVCTPFKKKSPEPSHKQRQKSLTLRIELLKRTEVEGTERPPEIWPKKQNNQDITVSDKKFVTESNNHMMACTKLWAKHSSVKTFWIVY